MNILSALMLSSYIHFLLSQVFQMISIPYSFGPWWIFEIMPKILNNLKQLVT